MVIIDMKPLFTGATYQMTSVCSLEMSESCHALFRNFVNNFDLVSPDLGLQAELSKVDTYIDPILRLKFEYPLEWEVNQIHSSVDANLDTSPLIFPQAHPKYWKEISLSTNNLYNSNEVEIILITYIVDAQITSAEEWLDHWLNFQQKLNDSIAKFQQLNRTSISLDQHTAHRMDFIGAFKDSPEWKGSITTVEINGEIWQISYFCSSRFELCLHAYNQILSSMTFNPDLNVNSP